jgi:hypothetical protein
MVLKLINADRLTSLVGILLVIFLIQSPDTQAQKGKAAPSFTWKEKGICEISVADIVMEVDANLGGRITSFRLKNKEVLSSSAVNPETMAPPFGLVLKPGNGPHRRYSTEDLTVPKLIRTGYF